VLPGATNDPVFVDCLAELERSAAGPLQGIFGPESATWEALREVVVPVLGLRAVVLQAAHPSLAAAAYGHSRYQDDFSGRARRTFAAVNTIIFGDLSRALGTARALRAMHARITGTIPNEVSPRRTGTPYSGVDPEVGLWVIATMIESSLHALDITGIRIPHRRLEAFVIESARLGLAFGVPAESMPKSVDAVRRHIERVVDGDVLEGGPAIRRLIGSILDQPLLVRLGLSGLAPGLLPERVRDLLGLRWSRGSAARFKIAIRALGAAVSSLGPGVRFVPAFHRAEARLSMAGLGRAPLFSMLIGSLDAAVGLPLGLR
jgi:uncharacterized protein (DUF2236 family)